MNDLKQIKKQSKKSMGIKKALIYFGLSIWALAVLFPFYWMLQNSFKSFGEYNSEFVPAFFPSAFTFENYITAFVEVNLGQYLLNTLVFTLLTTAIMFVVIILAAFAFARLEFKGKNLAFTLLLALMMIPNELYLAAQVDGSSDFTYLVKVMVPISSPTIVTVLILKIIECWNSYVWPRLITDDETLFLVSNGIQTIRESGFGRENIPAMMAAVVIISVPLIVLFLIFKDRIMEGVSRGGTKG